MIRTLALAALLARGAPACGGGAAPVSDDRLRERQLAPYAKLMVDAGAGRWCSTSRQRPLAARRRRQSAAARGAPRPALRRAQARRVFAFGAPLGGAVAVRNGATLPVSGILGLSGTRVWPGSGINH
jgi:hypothetical protein